MADIRLCSINDRSHHIGTVYGMTVGPLSGTPQLVYKDNHLFQPTKEIVFGHKHHNGDARYKFYTPINDREYTDAYRLIIAQQMPLIKEWYASLGERDQLTLCCYCAPGKFCHRQLVAKTLTWLNGKMSLNHTVNLF